MSSYLGDVEEAVVVVPRSHSHVVGYVLLMTNASLTVCDILTFGQHTLRRFFNTQSTHWVRSIRNHWRQNPEVIYWGAICNDDIGFDFQFNSQDNCVYVILFRKCKLFVCNKFIMFIFCVCNKYV